MSNFKTAVVFIIFGIALALFGGSLRAAPDGTLGMALLSARVNSNGTVAAGAGLVSAEKTSTGNYKIVFNRTIYPSCTLVATISGVGPSGEQGLIAASRSAGGFAVVRTYKPDGTKEDRPFNLIAFCES